MGKETYIHTYMHTYIHTYVHTYVHTWIFGISIGLTYAIFIYIHFSKILCASQGPCQINILRTQMSTLACMHTYIHPYISTVLHTYTHSGHSSGGSRPGRSLQCSWLRWTLHLFSYWSCLYPRAPRAPPSRGHPPNRGPV